MSNRINMPTLLENNFSSPAIMPEYLGMPVGAVIAFAGEIRSNLGDSGSHKTNLPMFNWLVCDGSEVKIAQYPELFNALGFRYGKNKSDGNFKLPNYQGTFLRGVGVDDASTQSRTSPGDSSDNSVGSKQGYALLSHTHTYYKPQTGVVIPSTEPSGGISAPPMSTNTGGASPSENKQSDLETRPVNTFVYWLIKTKLD